MAKSGGRRAYARDSRGRFASTPGSAAKKAAKSQSGRTSTLQARSSLKRSRAKLAAKDKADETLQGTLGRKAQKGAVTRRSRELAGAQTAAQARISGGRKGVVGKPRGLKPGKVTNRIMDRDRATIKAASARIDRANKRNRRLASIQREIDYKRANPVGGKTFKGQATKRLNKEQRKLDKSKATVFSAIELNYKPKRQKAEARLAQMTMAVRAVSGLRVPRKKAVYQRNVFGGSTVSYGR